MNDKPTLNKVAVIAWSGEKGSQWIKELPDAGWTPVVLDTGHRTSRDHPAELRRRERENRLREAGVGRFGGPHQVSIAEMLAQFRGARHALLAVRAEIDAALSEPPEATGDEAPPPIMTKVPNFPGIKESAAWLQWIIANFDDLPDQVAFLQGWPFDHCAEIVPLLASLPEVYEPTCLPHQEWSHYNEQAIGDGRLGPHIDALFKAATGRPLTIWRWSPGAQFVCSAENLRPHGREFFVQLFEIAKKTPYAAEVLERLWPALLRQ